MVLCQQRLKFCGRSYCCRVDYPGMIQAIEDVYDTVSLLKRESPGVNQTAEHHQTDFSRLGVSVT